MKRLICFLFDHDWAGPRNRWTWCMRCQRNIYTGGNRGR